LHVPRSRAWDLVTAALIAAMLVAHARFVALDLRLPQDPNHCHGALPQIFAHLWPLQVGETLRHLLLETTGWYNVLLAAVLHVFDRSPAVFGVFYGLWLAVILVTVAWLARRLWGSRAAALAIALIPPTSESIVLVGRMGWIHVTELALFLVVLALLVADPALVKRRTPALAALVGAMGIAIRPSGMIWGAVAALLLLSGVLEAEKRKRFLVWAGAVLVVWALALVPVILDLRRYAQDKLESRDKYEFLADPQVLLAGVRGDVGPVAGAMALAGVVVLLVRLPRARWRVVALLLLWLVLPFVLYAVFHAGLPNFPAYVPALAVLGAAGLARLPWPVALVPLLAWLPLYTAQWMPAGAADAVYGRAPFPLPGTMYVQDPLNYYRVDRTLDPQTVVALIETTCPNRVSRQCTIHVDRCLTRPHGVDPGRIDLFLLGVDNVLVAPVWDPKVKLDAHAGDGLSSYICRQSEEDWHHRFRDLEGRRDRVIRSHDYQPVWSRQYTDWCRYTWYTRGGETHGRLPDGGAIEAGEELDVPGMEAWDKAKR